jgi:hypothetical protein
MTMTNKKLDLTDKVVFDENPDEGLALVATEVYTKCAYVPLEECAGLSRRKEYSFYLSQMHYVARTQSHGLIVVTADLLPGWRGVNSEKCARNAKLREEI